MKALIFPGQGSQFPKMGQRLPLAGRRAQQLAERADAILGFKLSEILREGTAEQLAQTSVTQPAVFLHSLLSMPDDNYRPDAVAGHSLGELTALVASQAITFEDGLKLVACRANAMQKACERTASGMAVVIGLGAGTIEQVCRQVSGPVIPANYNCPDQTVISGSKEGIRVARKMLKEAGAKAVMDLPVHGAFHSFFMEPASDEFRGSLLSTPFREPVCPVYQNVDAKPVTDTQTLKANLLRQLTTPVRWHQTIQAMIHDGVKTFIECGPGDVLQGLVRKINREVALEKLTF